MNKAREKFCPRCSDDITDTYEEDGWPPNKSWYCDRCELPVEDDHDE